MNVLGRLGWEMFTLWEFLELRLLHRVCVCRKDPSVSHDLSQNFTVKKNNGLRFFYPGVRFYFLSNGDFWLAVRWRDRLFFLDSWGKNFFLFLRTTARRMSVCACTAGACATTKSAPSAGHVPVSSTPPSTWARPTGTTPPPWPPSRALSLSVRSCWSWCSFSAASTGFRGWAVAWTRRVCWTTNLTRPKGKKDAPRPGLRHWRLQQSHLRERAGPDALLVHGQVLQEPHDHHTTADDLLRPGIARLFPAYLVTGSWLPFWSPWHFHCILSIFSGSIFFLGWNFFADILAPIFLFAHRLSPFFCPPPPPIPIGIGVASLSADPVVFCILMSLLVEFFFALDLFIFLFCSKKVYEVCLYITEKVNKELCAVNWPLNTVFFM